MKNAWKLVEAEAFDKAREHPLRVCHGKPARSNYIGWCKELEILAASFDISDSYKWTVDAAGNNFGCLALTMDAQNYILRTSIDTYIAPVEPPHYDQTIDINTPTFQRKQLEEDNEQKKHDYFTWKGASRGLSENLRDAMEEQYYDELKHSIVGYKNVTTLQILDHLDTKWVPMNTKEKKKIKAEYYKPWDVAGGVALSLFTKALDEKKEELTHHNITIDEEDVKEHYMVQMYNSKVFSEADMKEWTNKSVADKDDWTIMKTFFRDKMKLNEEYNNNNEGNEATLYGSAANITNAQEDKLADLGDEIRNYIQQITQAKENVPPPSSIIKPATTSNNSNKAVEEMTKRMTTLEAMMTNFCNNHGGGGGNNINGGGGGNNINDDKKRGRRDRFGPETRIRNMGGYCYSCGFNPVGQDHTSMTCESKFKKTNHDKAATWTSRGDGNGCMTWPTRIRDDQKTHELYAGKSAPTN